VTEKSLVTLQALTERSPYGDSKAATGRLGFLIRGMHKMIDDDFDKMVRHMFERFFNNSLGPDSNRSGIIRFGFQPSMDMEEVDVDLTKGKENLIEKIDLGDSLLIVMEESPSTEKIRIEVISKTVVVETGTNKEYIEIPTLVDIENSGYSVRNGILEIRLVKLDDEKTETVVSSGILQIEN
jgi:hypothetical protein